MPQIFPPEVTDSSAAQRRTKYEPVKLATVRRPIARVVRENPLARAARRQRLKEREQLVIDRHVYDRGPAPAPLATLGVDCSCGQVDIAPADPELGATVEPRVHRDEYLRPVRDRR